VCDEWFKPTSKSQRHCGRYCGTRHLLGRNRRAERPPFAQLLQEIEETNFLAVGRKYGVSDNAIRKWVRAYEAEARAQAAQD